MRIEEAGSSKGSLNCSKFSQYCNNGKKKSADELAKMRNKNNDNDDDIFHPTKDNDATLPVSTTTSNQNSQASSSNGPNWTKTVAWVALGVIFIGLGVAMVVSGGAIVVAAAAELAAASAGEAIGAAATLEAAQGLFVGTVWYGGWGAAGIGAGIKAIRNGVTP